MITIILSYFCEKVFTLMNILMIGKISMKHQKDFYNRLNMEDITDADYAYKKKVYKDFEIKNLGEYHDLFAQSNTLL